MRLRLLSTAGLRRLVPVLALGLACSGSGSGGAPVGPDVPVGTILRNLTFCTGGGSDLALDLYFPPVRSASRPVAVFVHGGVWTSGSKEEAGERWLALLRPPLVARGFVVASIEYRLAPDHRWPAQIEDAKCAVRFLRANAATYGIRPDRIGAWGSSAGAHLALLLGVTDPGVGFEGSGGWPGVSSRVQAVVDLYGPADLTSDDWPVWQRTVFPVVFGAADPTSPVLAQASPLTHVSPDDPPHLIIHGDGDEVVAFAQSQALFDQLRQAGVEAELVVVAGGRHGLNPNTGPIDPSESEIIQRIVAFFETELR